MILFFKNFIVALVTVGILTRIANFLYSKKVKREIAIYLSFFTVGVIILTAVAFVLGYDIAVSEYVVSLLIWLLFDIMRTGLKIKLRRKK